MAAASQSAPALTLPPPPRAWILADVDTGKVITASVDHVRLAPASLTKLLTGVIAAEDLPPDAQVPVSPTAQSMPASAIGMKAGQVWTLDQALHALLMVSANDAAVALAERIGGSREAYTLEMARWAGILGLVDHPVLEDPAGLDDNGSVGNGNRISAYDMATIARVALAVPVVSHIMSLGTYDFSGPGGAYHLVNHNQLLWLYPGAVGGKTGFTDLAGITYVGAAERNGRTMLVVEMGGTVDPYATAEAFLDVGFATPVGAESAADHLPAVRLGQPASAPETSAGTRRPVSRPISVDPVAAHSARPAPWWYWVAMPVAGLIVLGLISKVCVRFARRSKKGAGEKQAAGSQAARSHAEQEAAHPEEEPDARQHGERRELTAGSAQT